MNGRVVSMGQGAGIEFDFEHAFSVNTFDAHRMLQLAGEEGVEAALADDFFGAYFTGSADLSDHTDLVRLAVAAGVNPDRATEVASSDQFTAEVRADQELAGLLGITGVPAFVFDRTTAISGAQPVEVIRTAIDRAVDSAS
jgi:predicted DsbA family dithiol-disulfide isomerase